MKEVQVIEAKSNFIIDKTGHLVKPKLRVCAYCRVSTNDLDQQNSYEFQVAEYTKRIKDNPDYEFAGIYADEGISGTDTKKRKEFNRMIDDARAHKFDLIITKSVSRFARNTLTVLQYTRELKSLGIYVYFETQKMSTEDEKTETFLTLHSAMVQDEAKAVSDNVKWNIRSRMKQGVIFLNTSRFLGYKKDENGQLEIVPEEAKIIKEIYELYTAGVGPCEICRRMEQKGYITGGGKSNWNLSYVQSILKNEKYKGDLLLQKSYTEDFLTHKRIKNNINNNSVPMYYVANAIPPIVSREMWERAQEIRINRFHVQMGQDQNASKYLNKYPYSGLLMCMKCGSGFKRRYWNYGYASQRIVLQCSYHIKDKESCIKGSIDLEALDRCTKKVINKIFKNKKDVINDIVGTIEEVTNTKEYEKRIYELKDRKKLVSEKLFAVLDLKLNASTMDEKTILDTKYQLLTDELNDINEELDRYGGIDINDTVVKTRFDLIRNELKKFEDGDFEVTGELLHSFVNKILVEDIQHIIYLIPQDRIYSDDEIRKNRTKFAKYIPILEDSFTLSRRNKKYPIYYKVILI